jgi:hypothetical protein
LHGWFIIRCKQEARTRYVHVGRLYAKLVNKFCSVLRGRVT